MVRDELGSKGYEEYVKTSLLIETSGFKDPKEVYEHIGDVDELTDDVISLVSLAGLKFGYDFKHGN